MLRALTIDDMLLIRHLDLEFEPGLNVLTGETGAGKSILLDSLGFVLGWRGRGGVLRKGAESGEVTAVFDLSPDHPARRVLDEAGLAAGDELILRRRVRGDGRKQGFVNDRRVGAETLRELGAVLIELHGQRDDRGLMNARGHRALLDAFAGNGARLTACRAAWESLNEAEAALQARREELAALERDRDFLGHAVDELDEFAPQPGEDAALDSRRRMMKSAGRIREGILRAAEALGGEGAEGRVTDALRWLQDAEEAAGGRLSSPLAALARGLDELAEAQRGVAECLEALDFDPRELEAVEERLFALRALARKHGTLPDDLGALADDLRARLAALEGGERDLEALEAEVTQARKGWEAAADDLRQAREEAARRLDAAMAGELAPLRMERARFVTEIAEAPPGPEGRDSVRFTVATNPGTAPGPLDRIASGGELSRFMLALRVCLLEAGGGRVMIFDEIDRGVGGATADAVGRRLAALGQGGQVLVVTHSPQVAARGAHHFRVEKAPAGGETLTTVAPVAGESRVDEIARMLSGDRITEPARAAARALLAGE